MEIENTEIETYQKYIEFKREENFNCTDVKYENGRIKKLTFVQQ